MLAPTLDGNPPRLAPIANVRARSSTLDLVLLCIALAAASVLFFQGGLEALIGAGIGAGLGLRAAPWRNARFNGALSGAFAGLFTGALFAGFFHGPVAAAFFALP